MRLFKFLKMSFDNKYYNNGWIPIDTPPRRSYLGNFLIVVKRHERYQVWMSTYANFAKAGETFDCWQKHADHNYRSACPINKDEVVFWRPIPKLPKGIRTYSNMEYFEDPTEHI